jgi:hypothetical protein
MRHRGRRNARANSEVQSQTDYVLREVGKMGAEEHRKRKRGSGTWFGIGFPSVSAPYISDEESAESAP